MHFDASVVIPAKNASRFIHDSLRSVVNQKTRYRYEIIVVNDNSSDNTLELATELSGVFPYLRVINSPLTGISNALNAGINNAEGRYIIRHDADDLMIETRIQNQLDYLENNLDVVMVGGQIEPFGSSFLPKVNFYPIRHEEICKMSRFGNPFAHPTVTFRSHLVSTVGFYRAQFDGAEDFDLWLRILRIGQGANLSSVVTRYRVHEGQITKSNLKKVNKATYKVLEHNIKTSLLNFDFRTGLTTAGALAVRMLRDSIKV